MKILNLDDHPIFSQGFKESLYAHNVGFEVTSSLNAKQALGYSKANIDFDLLILDLSMPDMDGISFIKSLISRNIHIPIIFRAGLHNSGSACLEF
jgi:DNA-binding NarL/FixJ family response regulator